MIKERVTVSRNGYGAKLANIFSKKFEVEVGDEWHKNYDIEKLYTYNMKSMKFIFNFTNQELLKILKICFIYL